MFQKSFDCPSLDFQAGYIYNNIVNTEQLNI